MDMSQLLSDISRKAAEAVPEEPDDYQVDGLLYCGKCRTPKQMLLQPFGTMVRRSWERVFSELTE